MGSHSERLVTLDTYTGWKKFRFCPRIPGVEKKDWTVRGINTNTCFDAIGKIRMSRGTSIHVQPDGTMKAKSATLIWDSLLKVSTVPITKSTNIISLLPLSDDDGVVTSMRDYKFEYLKDREVRSQGDFNASAGIHFYRCPMRAIDYGLTTPSNISLPEKVFDVERI